MNAFNYGIICFTVIVILYDYFFSNLFHLYFKVHSAEQKIEKFILSVKNYRLIQKIYCLFFSHFEKGCRVDWGIPTQDKEGFQPFVQMH